MSVRTIGHNGWVTHVPDDRILSEDGQSGWFAFEPDGKRIADEDETWQPPPAGSVVRLMGDHGVTVPLWSDRDGLMFSEPDELVSQFGVSQDLADVLRVWAVAWEGQAGQPGHDAEAVRLVHRLNVELDNRYRFVYRP